MTLQQKFIEIVEKNEGTYMTVKALLEAVKEYNKEVMGEKSVNPQNITCSEMCHTKERFLIVQRQEELI